MSVIRRVIVSIGFIISGLLIASVELHPLIAPLQIYQREIFNTNCLLIFNKDVNLQQPLPGLNSKCETIQWMLPASFIATGVVILLCGLNKITCFIAAINLASYVCLYCNPLIDPSFTVYAHAIELSTCILGLLYHAFSFEPPSKN